MQHFVEGIDLLRIAICDIIVQHKHKLLTAPFLCKTSFHVFTEICLKCIVSK